jgi:UDP-glucose 4-epimerase
MTPLIELELMRSAVNGKLGLWQTLESLAPDLGLPRAMFADLVELARSQSTRLESLHEIARQSSFRRADQVEGPHHRQP